MSYPRSLRWFGLIPFALLANALACRWECLECTGADRLEDDNWAGPAGPRTLGP